jgi:hypothetical protein
MISNMISTCFSFSVGFRRCVAHTDRLLERALFLGKARTFILKQAWGLTAFHQADYKIPEVFLFPPLDKEIS